jgi:radical S-adenosyl methionine domain-containing protein 2
MKLSKEAGMGKLDFAGGEPFLYPIFMQKLRRYVKEDLKIQSMSIISNVSKTMKRFLHETAANLLQCSRAT